MKRLFLGILALFLVLASGVNAFTLNTIPDQTWNEKYPWTLDLAGYVTKDPANPAETFTYAVKSKTGTDLTISMAGSVATITFVDEDWTGNSDVVFTVTGSVGGAQDTNSFKLIKNVPAYCDIADGRNYIEIKSANIDFDDETYKIGDTVKVTMSDVKALVEDLETVETTFCLYNVDQKAEVDCWDATDSFDINDGDTEDYDVEFTIPNSEDIGKKDKYRLVVYVIGDDESGDKQCVQASDNIKIERETYDVTVESLSLSPGIVKQGESVQVTVKVENIGTKDEKDVYVKLKDDLLKIDLESSRFDLDNYQDSDNTNTVRFTITIPEDAKAQDYILEPTVYFDDGDKTNAGKTATLKVESSVIAPKKAPFEVTTSDTKIDATKGKSTSLHLIITSNDANDVDATIELSALGNWADAIAPQAVSLHNGENNIYLPLTLKETTPGMHTATVTIKPVGKSNFDVKQSTLSFEVTGEVKEVTTTPVTGLTTAVSGFKGSSLFWIIGDIVLVIIALFFIKAIFFGKKD